MQKFSYLCPLIRIPPLLYHHLSLGIFPLNIECIYSALFLFIALIKSSVYTIQFHIEVNISNVYNVLLLTFLTLVSFGIFAYYLDFHIILLCLINMKQQSDKCSSVPSKPHIQQRVFQTCEQPNIGWKRIWRTQLYLDNQNKTHKNF